MTTNNDIEGQIENLMLSVIFGKFNNNSQSCWLNLKVVS